VSQGVRVVRDHNCMLTHALMERWVRRFLPGVSSQALMVPRSAW
jgi:hypothetical protein